MLHSAYDLKGFGIDASDGSIGSVTDLLFDDASWRVRWLVVDTGNWLPGRVVVLPPSVLKDIDERRRTIAVPLSKQQVHDSPPLSAHEPVSRQRESEIYTYYGWEPYWAGGLGPGGMLPGGALAVPASPTPSRPVPVQAPTQAGARVPPGAEGGDAHLRSASEVTGSAIAASDGELGHVEDFLVDGHDWMVRYIVVDTANWWPGKKTIIAPDWVDDISWSERRVSVGLTREKIKASPEYVRGPLVERPYEGQLYAHYGFRPYWE